MLVKGGLVAIAGATTPVPSHVVKSKQHIWTRGIERWSLRMTDVQMNCSDFTDK